MDNLEFVFSLFNQYLFQDAKNNISALQYYFDTNYSTAGNKLVGELIDAIKTYDLASIDLPLLNSVMMKTGKTPDESNKIISEIVKWKQFDRKQIEPARKFLEEVVAGSIIQKANNLFPNQPSEYLKYLKNAEIKTSTSETLSTISFDQLDLNSVLAGSLSDTIPSCFDFVNKSFPDGGYYRSQLVLYSMPPGCGKSLAAAQEALFMASNGYKVHYLVLGDLQTSDFIIRLSSIYSGLPFRQVKDNLKTIYNGLCQIVEDRLQFTVLPAGVITVDEYIEFIQDKDYDVLIIDYDGNFKVDLKDSSMYTAYGELYEKLTRLTAKGFLVFILSQPKIYSWKNPEIDLSEVGESAKKQMTIDVAITRGREPDCPNHLGIFKIVKNRRGNVDVRDYSIRLNNGRFMSIPKAVYNQLKQETEEKDYTAADIEGMINQYRNQYNNVNRMVNQASQSQQRVSGPTPFGRP